MYTYYLPIDGGMKLYGFKLLRTALLSVSGGFDNFT